MPYLQPSRVVSVANASGLTGCGDRGILSIERLGDMDRESLLSLSLMF